MTTTIGPRRLRPLAAASVATFLVAALVVAGPAPAAHACSCLPVSDTDAFATADAVFVGDVVSHQAPPARAVMSSADPATWTFSVSDVYKGDVTSTQQVVSAVSSVSCGLELSGPGPFLVFASRDSPPVPLQPGQYHAGLCGGTRPLAEGPPAFIADPAPPRPADAGAPGSPDEDGSSATLGTVLVATTIAAALVALAVYALRRRGGEDG